MTVVDDRAAPEGDFTSLAGPELRGYYRELLRHSKNIRQSSPGADLQLRNKLSLDASPGLGLFQFESQLEQRALVPEIRGEM